MTITEARASAINTVLEYQSNNMFGRPSNHTVTRDDTFQKPYRHPVEYFYDLRDQIIFNILVAILSITNCTDRNTQRSLHLITRHILFQRRSVHCTFIDLFVDTWNQYHLFLAAQFINQFENWTCIRQPRRHRKYTISALIIAQQIKQLCSPSKPLLKCPTGLANNP